MKRFIAVLLVMGVIMTAFAATGTAGKVNITGNELTAADTDVVLQLAQNAGIVWFSAGSNPNVSTYFLSLPEISRLNQDTSGNSNWYATGPVDLYLNWNIVSCSTVKIILEIDGKLKGTNSSSNEIGWKVSFKEKIYSGNSLASDNSNASVYLCAGYPGEVDAITSAMAIKKKNDVYGSSGSLKIDEIITENTYGKNVDTYKATITAKVVTVG